jgi:uncharacterized protein (TIGR03032 family)
VAFCPGYARGLALHGDFAVVGLSKPRDSKTFTGLELDEALRARDVEARCGLLVIDLRTGDVVHSLRLEGVIAELYDVAVLPLQLPTSFLAGSMPCRLPSRRCPSAVSRLEAVHSE